MDKKGIEMQINFLVMIIIGLIVFGFGVFLVTKTFSQTTELKDEMDKKAEAETLSYLNSGKVISLGINRKEIERGNTDTFVLGLINKLGKEIDCMVIIENPTYVNDLNEKEEIPDDYTYANDWTFTERGPFSLSMNQKETIPLSFRIPGEAKKGMYTFILKVYYDDPGEIVDQNDPIFAEQPQVIHIEVI